MHHTHTYMPATHTHTCTHTCTRTHTCTLATLTQAEAADCQARIDALKGGTAEEKEASKEDLDKEAGALRMAQARVEAETEKREQHRAENARRRHDFVPFLLKALELAAKENDLPAVYDTTKKRLA